MGNCAALVTETWSDVKMEVGAVSGPMRVRQFHQPALERPSDARHALAVLHLGGVRIEDNVLVTQGAPKVLTSEI